MKSYFSIIFILVSFLVFTGFIDDDTKIKNSEETEACLNCHRSVTPGIVHDWLDGVHSRQNTSGALLKDKLKRKISLNENSFTGNKSVSVGCYECHSLNPESHKDNFEHFGYKINVIVSPNDCKSCHPVEVEQYSTGKKSHAIDNLIKNPVYNTLVETITSVKDYNSGDIISDLKSNNPKNESCLACHGTEVKVTGSKTINSALGDADVPVLTNWPNQGVGRINPDGSKGTCTACHPRHSFSIEIARKPYTCGQCHLEPDVPAYNVYKESKHGNIFDSKKDKWNWESVPWTIGKDFTAPSCAACHNSLLTDENGETIAERSHNFGNRLWDRLFGLIYSVPQPKQGLTTNIKNKDGLPLPVSFDNTPAKEYLIDSNEQSKRKNIMTGICMSCHSTSWTEGHFAKLNKTIEETNRMTLAATGIMLEGWNRKINNNQNPFDESLEQKWIKQWLFYSNSVRYASAMSGPDYAGFKNGWWDLSRNLEDMRTELSLQKKKK